MTVRSPDRPDAVRAGRSTRIQKLDCEELSIKTGNGAGDLLWQLELECWSALATNLRRLDASLLLNELSGVT